MQLRHQLRATIVLLPTVKIEQGITMQNHARYAGVVGNSLSHYLFIKRIGQID
ncbi:hypothetical protein [Yersinia alsatica]|uniref:hypothetical protein n=1 Tax=Yersinia alsatica TaxID=2890317 RepID=UPI001F45B0F9|nr:hypothetical protein [Yersinia alsatica]